MVTIGALARDGAPAAGKAADKARVMKPSFWSPRGLVEVWLMIALAAALPFIGLG